MHVLTNAPWQSRNWSGTGVRPRPSRFMSRGPRRHPRTRRPMPTGLLTRSGGPCCAIAAGRGHRGRSSKSLRDLQLHHAVKLKQGLWAIRHHEDGTQPRLESLALIEEAGGDPTLTEIRPDIPDHDALRGRLDAACDAARDRFFHDVDRVIAAASGGADRSQQAIPDLERLRAGYRTALCRRTCCGPRAPPARACRLQEAELAVLANVPEVADPRQGVATPEHGLVCICELAIGRRHGPVRIGDRTRGAILPRTRVSRSRTWSCTLLRSDPTSEADFSSSSLIRHGAHTTESRP